MFRFFDLSFVRSFALTSALCVSAFSIQAQAADYESDFSRSASEWKLQVPRSQQEKQCSMAVVPREGRKGRSALRTASQDYATYRLYLEPSIPVRPGTRYRVTGWFRAEEGAEVESRFGPGPFLRVSFKAGSGNTNAPSLQHLFLSASGRVGSVAFVEGKLDGKEVMDTWFDLPRRVTGILRDDLSLTEEWTQTEAVVEVPAGADFMELSLVVYRVNGALLWDDIEVEEVSRSTPLSPLAGEAKPGAVGFDWNTVTDAEMFAKLNLDLLGMAAVKDAVQAGDYEKAKAAYLSYRRGAGMTRWRDEAFVVPDSPGTQIDQTAEKICGNVIVNRRYKYNPPITEAYMGRDFDWDHNPVPKDSPNYTREWNWCVVGRMIFWNDLADAYRKTHNEKYAQKWIWLLKDFAQDNPLEDPGMHPGSSNVWRTIDTGIRMFQAWPNSYYAFINSPSFTPEDNWLFAKLTYAQAQRLKHGLVDYPERDGNWINIEASGLYITGTLFPEFRESAEWRDIAVDRLVKEMDLSVTPEGMQAEFSPSYHFGAVAGWRRVFDIAKMNDLEVPEVFSRRLIDMYRAPALIMDQSGKPVCTNDSGPVNMRRMAAEGLEIGPDPVLEWLASGGEKGTPLPASTAIESGGLYAMRGGWAPEDLFLYFRGGPAGIGHEEQDMLQVVLNAWGQELLLEPGRYAYDKSEWRRYSINTPSHNTVIVDGKWQNRPKTKPPVNTPMDNPWVTTPLFDFVSATYDKGYQENAYAARQYRPQQWVGERDMSVSHTRRVLFLRPWYALVLDSLDGTGEHSFDAHFHLDAPSARIDTASQAAFSERTDGVQLGLYPLDREHLSVEVVQGQKDPLLGWVPAEQRPIPTVRFRKEQEAPAVFSTFLYPYKGEQPAFVTEPLDIVAEGEAAWAWALETGHESAELAVVGKGAEPVAFTLASVLAGDVRAYASGLLLRQPGGGGEILAGGWNLRSYEDERLAFATDGPVALNFFRNEDGESLMVINDGSSSVRIRVTRPFAVEATLQPGQWTRLTGDGAEAVAEIPAVLGELVLVDAD